MAEQLKKEEKVGLFVCLFAPPLSYASSTGTACMHALARNLDAFYLSNPPFLVVCVCVCTGA